MKGDERPECFFSATQRYLTMTPELLQQANRRFEQYAGGGADER
jgi:hypothetical protein